MAKPKIKTYEVTLYRTVEQSITVRVDALNEEEAIEVAWDDDHAWRNDIVFDQRTNVEKVK